MISKSRSLSIAAWMLTVSFGGFSSVAHASGETDTAEALEAELAGDSSRTGHAVMGDHATTYVSYGRYRGRAHNVELAASLLDGTVVSPGSELSFNEQVGLRIEARGFRPAPVIANGRVRMGIGGGVCQVATTLHLAALEAGLEIVERRAHSFPSHYVAPGLDATVADGRIDFRVRNPHAYAVTVRAKALDGQLVVMVLGDEARPRDLVEAVTVRRLDAAQGLVADPDLAAGEQAVARAGRRGSVVQVTRRRADGTVVSIDRVVYAPTARVVRVGS